MAARRSIIRVAAVFAVLVAVVTAQAKPPVSDHEHPLELPDRSTPYATLNAFLESGDAIGSYLQNEYLPNPTREKYEKLTRLGAMPLRFLDTGDLPDAARIKAAAAAALALYETLNRLELPPPGEVPGGQPGGPVDLLLPHTETPVDAGEAAFNALPDRWFIPHTRIALVRMTDGANAGDYLFSADTVEQADDYYDVVRNLPYKRDVPFEHLTALFAARGGWMVPYEWIQALPASLRSTFLGQATWKWFGLVVVFALTALLLRIGYRLSLLGSDDHPFRRALSHIALPLAVLIAAPAIVYMGQVQLNLIGGVASSLQIVMTAIFYLAGAWLAWRFAPVAAEALIASPQIAPESLDANLIRLAARLLGIVGGASIIAIGADRVGVPVYGIVAGLGVGGLAIALAAQPTVENLIGGLSLFADRPVRVGDQCMFGDGFGTVESIGIRSARIRGLDRTLTTIPNAALAKMAIVNYTARDRMLLKTTVGLRYETTAEQLRYVLAKLRELLLAHPRIHPEPARARFVGFGDSSLDISIHAYALTNDWAEFFKIREDVFLRIIDIVEESGTSIAFPSQTLYLGRDAPADTGKRDNAEAAIRAWREQEALPFPDFSAEQLRHILDTTPYPPEGSAGEQNLPGTDPGDPEPPPAQE